MKKLLVTLGVVALLLAIGVLRYIPLSAPEEICRPIARWDGAEAGWRFNHPMDVAWGDGFLYVADTENGAVKKIRTDGTLVTQWRGFQMPVAVAATADGRAVYVADFLADRVVKLAAADGAVLAQWGYHGSRDGEFDAPSGIAVETNGDVYVTEFYNHRVQKFTRDGSFVARWGSDGRWNGEFHYPTGVAVDPSGNIFVADAYNHRIEKLAADGAYLAKWGGIGYGLSGRWGGWFRLAKAVAADQAGNVYVADAFNHRIQKFTADGKLLGMWGNEPSAKERQSLRYPSGLAVDSDGLIYVSDFFENRIWKLDCR